MCTVYYVGCQVPRRLPADYEYTMTSGEKARLVGLYGLFNSVTFSVATWSTMTVLSILDKRFSLPYRNPNLKYTNTIY